MTQGPLLYVLPHPPPSAEGCLPQVSEVYDILIRKRSSVRLYSGYGEDGEQLTVMPCALTAAAFDEEGGGCMLRARTPDAGVVWRGHGHNSCTARVGFE